MTDLTLNYDESVPEVESDNHLDTANKPRQSIVLIDDCPIFRHVMESTAADMNVDITCFSSLAEMYSLAHFSNYDLALIDYHLDSWCGLEIAKYIDIFFKNLPVVLVSGDSLEKQATWPSSIRDVLDKKVGPRAIIESALSTLDKFLFYQFIEQRTFSTNPEVNAEIFQ